MGFEAENESQTDGEPEVAGSEAQELPSGGGEAVEARGGEGVSLTSEGSDDRMDVDP